MFVVQYKYNSASCPFQLLGIRGAHQDLLPSVRLPFRRLVRRSPRYLHLQHSADDNPFLDKAENSLRDLSPLLLLLVVTLFFKMPAIISPGAATDHSNVKASPLFAKSKKQDDPRSPDKDAARLASAQLLRAAATAAGPCAQKTGRDEPNGLGRPARP